VPRPKKPRFLRFKPHVYYFKPRGIPLRLLEEVILLPDEVEALKLHELDGLEQKEGAKQMKISQSTFARILAGAYKKITKGIIQGKAIRIEEKEKFTSFLNNKRLKR
jgi:predicted DNA-binding protein (UPF0251 family)